VGLHSFVLQGARYLVILFLVGRLLAFVFYDSFRYIFIGFSLSYALSFFSSYDFAPIIGPTFGSCSLAVSSLTSGKTNFRHVTGGVCKARERIQRRMADRRLLAIPASWGRVADPNPN